MYLPSVDPDAEPRYDFSNADAVRAIGHAIGSVSEQLGLAYGHLAAGDGLDAVRFQSCDPCEPSTVMGTFPNAGPAEFGAARAAAQEAAKEWAGRPAAQRVRVLERVVDALRLHRNDFTAWVAWETGMEWPYADEQVSLAIYECVTPPQVVRDAHEEPSFSEVYGRPESPFHQPARMLARSIAAGKAAIWYPHPTASIVGWKLGEVFRDCGVPEHVVQTLFTTDRSGDTDPVVRRGVFRLPAVGTLDGIVDELPPGAVTYAGQAYPSTGVVVGTAERLDAFTAKLETVWPKRPMGFTVDSGTRLGPLIDESTARAWEAWCADQAEWCVIEGSRAAPADWPGWFYSPSLWRRRADSLPADPEARAAWWARARATAGPGCTLLEVDEGWDFDDEDLPHPGHGVLDGEDLGRDGT